MAPQRIQLTGSLATNPEPYSLDQEDCVTLQALVKTLAPEWSADIHCDPVGEISLMIMPPEVRDEIGPLLVVHKVASVFRLDQFRWDVYSVLGEYLAFDDLVRAVRRTLLALPGMCADDAVRH